MNDFIDKNSVELIMAPRAEDISNKLTLAWFKSVVACKGNINDTGTYSKKRHLNSHKGQGETVL